MDGGQDIQATGLNLIPLVQRVRPIEYRLPNAAHGISTNEISNELAKIRNETTREGWRGMRKVYEDDDIGYSGRIYSRRRVCFVIKLYII